MNEELKKFLETVSQSEELSTKFKDMIDSNEPLDKWVEFAKENGFELTEADFKSVEENKELSLDELADVTGGSLIDIDVEIFCPKCGELLKFGTWKERMESAIHLIKHAAEGSK